MEDNRYAVFRSEAKQVVYKQLLNIDDVKDLNDHLIKMIDSDLVSTNIGTSLVSGKRVHIDVDLKSQDYKDLCINLKVTLRDYFPDLRLDPNARLYSQSYGSIKPHLDKNHDGVSNYTLLLYLTDNFDDGRLSIKMKRSFQEMQESEPNKFHKTFTFKPLRGYGIIFNKNLLHWASDIFSGIKNFLLIHFHSDF